MCILIELLSDTMLLGERSRKVFQPYKTAMVQGVADLMHEYTEDISYLEQIILAEGPIPLSQLLQHLQKVNIDSSALVVFASVLNYYDISVGTNKFDQLLLLHRCLSMLYSVPYCVS